MKSGIQNLLGIGVENSDLSGWRPLRLQLSDDADRRTLSTLLRNKQITTVHDMILDQLIGLLETRRPDEHLSSDQLLPLAEDHLGGISPDRYGCWFFYPWSHQLVHVLPEAEFRELRTSRNRDKITLEEQAKLRTLRIGVVGLSVGNATAVTLALEEVGGHYRLADGDHLELSNVNRLRTGVYNLGLNKAYVTAREIFEINPYADVQVYADGVNRRNVEEYLTANGGLNLVFDECDDIEMKVLLRERAREAGIPVIMETSDRGMIDVERFDVEPQRPVLHGLLGDLVADELSGLATAEKIPLILRMVGSESLSLRMAASLVEVGSTIKTWPQLASAVALGGALTTDVARRIALGEFLGSGRYYVDIGALVSDAVDGSVEAALPLDLRISKHAEGMEALPVRRAGDSITEEQLRTLVTYGAMAPSGGNCQPWQFVCRGKVLYVLHDRKRSKSFLDFEDTASHVAFGAVAENIDRVAAEMGLATDIQFSPAGLESNCICGLRFKPGSDGTAAEASEVIARRATNRRLGAKQPLSDNVEESLIAAAHSRGGILRLVKGDAELSEVADIMARGDRLRFFSEIMHREMMSEIRWNRREVEQTRDGIDVATLGLSVGDLAGLRLVSSWRVMDMLSKLGAGSVLERPTRSAVASASAVGLALYPGYGSETFFRGGRAVQAVWLSATEHNLAFQPMTALTFLWLRLLYGRGDGLAGDEKRELRGLLERFSALFDLTGDLSPIMLFRVAQNQPPSARSLRRRVDDILSFQ